MKKKILVTDGAGFIIEKSIIKHLYLININYLKEHYCKSK